MSLPSQLSSVQVPLGDVVGATNTLDVVLHHGGQSTVALRSAAAECQPQPSSHPVSHSGECGAHLAI